MYEYVCVLYTLGLSTLDKLQGHPEACPEAGAEINISLVDK
jgi:hypothetical protein